MNESNNAIGSRWIGILLLAFLAACAGTQTPSERPSEQDPVYHYALAFLTAGERAGELNEAAVTAAGHGHHAHIARMGTEGSLLLAGPFGEPRAEQSWRGIYVFDLSDVNEAYDLARSDPAIQAGLFDVTIMPWNSDVDLRPLRDELEREKAAGIPFAPKAYVLVTGDATEGMQGALRELRSRGSVICAGELGGDRANQILILLAAESVEEARSWLKTESLAANWEFSSFWATALLGNLAMNH